MSICKVADTVAPFGIAYVRAACRSSMSERSAAVAQPIGVAPVKRKKRSKAI